MEDCYCLKLFLFGILCVFPQVLACGISTHIEIGERAAEFLDVVSEGQDIKELIRRHGDAFQAGGPYPDSYYPSLCKKGVYHAVSEDTHWTPFLEVAINYIRDNFTRPWDRPTQKLVVFLLAVTGHQVSDASWHSLQGIEQGFLSAMANINYHGSFGDAHDHGDIGGDILNLFELDTDYIGTLLKWYVPAEDLVNIYTLYYGEEVFNVTVVEDCTRWMYLGRLGEQLNVVDRLFPWYARHSPFLVDHLNDYFLGGMDDMSVWSGRTWQKVVHMIDHGTESCDLPNNPIFITCDNATKSTKDKSNWSNPPYPNVQKWTDPAKYIRDLTADDVIVERIERGIEFRPSEKFVELFKQKLSDLDRIKTFGAVTSHTNTKAVSADFYYDTTHPYSRLGECLLSADVNQDSYDDIIICAPGYGSAGNQQQGRVYILHGSSEGLPQRDLFVEEEADVILEVDRLNGRFGSSVAVVDINTDGYNDLAISAPQVGSADLTYQGEVFIFFGSHDGLSQEPDVTISCQGHYCNLGWSLSSGDVNADGYMDLLVGAPFAPSGGEQRGLVGLLLANKSIAGGTNLTEKDFDKTWTGSQDYEWLGYSTVFQGGALAIGAPTFRICTREDCTYNTSDVQSVGRLYIYERPLESEEAIILNGSTEFGQLGSSLSIGQGGNVLTVGEITSVLGNSSLHQPGLVYLYDWPISSENTSPRQVLSGDRSYSRFGSSVQFVGLSGSTEPDVVVGAPYRTINQNLPPEGEEGGVFIYLGGEGYILDNNKQPDIELVSGETKSRFGTDIAIAETVSQVNIAVSSSHSNIASRMGGRVSIFVMDKQ